MRLVILVIRGAHLLKISNHFLSLAWLSYIPLVMKAGNDFFVEKKVKKKKEEKKYQLLSERRVTDRYE